MKINFLFIIFLFVGCSVSTDVKNFSAKNYIVKSPSAVYLEVTSSKMSGEVSDIISDVKAKLVSRLISEGIASSISHSSSRGNKLHVNILDYKKVSGTSRVLLGMLAGSNSIKAQVDFKDSSNRILESFQINSKSALHPFSGVSDFTDAADEFASKVIKELKY